MKNRAIGYITAGLLALGSWAYSGDSEIQNGRMSREDWKMELRDAERSRVQQQEKLFKRENRQLDLYFENTKERREGPCVEPKKDDRKLPPHKVVYDRGVC